MFVFFAVAFACAAATVQAEDTNFRGSNVFGFQSDRQKNSNPQLVLNHPSLEHAIRDGNADEFREQAKGFRDRFDTESSMPTFGQGEKEETLEEMKELSDEFWTEAEKWAGAARWARSKQRTAATAPLQLRGRAPRAEGFERRERAL